MHAHTRVHAHTHTHAQNLGGLVNLRRASFADNQISHIEGLEGCSTLEELCLEDNRIACIEGLQGLTRWGHDSTLMTQHKGLGLLFLNSSGSMGAGAGPVRARTTRICAPQHDPAQKFRVVVFEFVRQHGCRG